MRPLYLPFTTLGIKTEKIPPISVLALLISEDAHRTRPMRFAIAARLCTPSSMPLTNILRHHSAWHNMVLGYTVFIQIHEYVEEVFCGVAFSLFT